MFAGLVSKSSLCTFWYLFIYFWCYLMYAGNAQHTYILRKRLHGCVRHLDITLEGATYSLYLAFGDLPQCKD